MRSVLHARQKSSRDSPARYRRDATAVSIRLTATYTLLVAHHLDEVPFSGIIRIRDMMYAVKDPFRLDQGT